MAGGTVLSGVEPVADKCLVNIRMAIVAFKANIPEDPF